LERGDGIVVALGDDDSGHTGEHAVEHVFGQVMNVVFGRIHDRDALVVAAGHHEEVTAGEKMVVAVGDAYIDNDRQPQVIGDIEQLFVRVALVDVSTEAKGSGAALEALRTQEPAVERDIRLHDIYQPPDGGARQAPGGQDL